MTERRDFDRLTRAWLDLMPDQAPDRSVAAVLQTIERTPQVRPPLVVLRRFQPVNRFSLAAIAAVLAVVLVGGGYMLTRSTPPSVGTSPSPSASPLASPTGAATLPPAVPAAQTLWGDWVADPGPIAGLPAQDTRIQMSISWQDGLAFWIQTNYTSGTQALNSSSVAHTPDQLRLVSTVASGGCPKGAIGTYSFVRSADGLFLTLTLVSDDCALRATVLARTWVHTISAVNDGGPGVLPTVNIQVTLPSRKFGLSGGDTAGDDTTVDAPFVGFLFAKDARGFAKPCDPTDRQQQPAMTSSAAVVAYLRGLPGFTVKTANVTIDGHPAVHVTGTPRPGFSCAAGDIGLYWDGNVSDPWSIAPGTALSAWVTQVRSDVWLFWYRGDQITAADESAVISSIRFITALPTP